MCRYIAPFRILTDEAVDSAPAAVAYGRSLLPIAAPSRDCFRSRVSWNSALPEGGWVFQVVPVGAVAHANSVRQTRRRWRKVTWKSERLKSTRVPPLEPKWNIRSKHVRRVNCCCFRTPIQCDFPLLGLSVKLPKTLNETALAIRLAWLTYDHFSDRSTSWKCPPKPERLYIGMPRLQDDFFI